MSEQISVDNRLMFVDVCSQGPINFPIQNDVSRMRRDLGHRLMTMGVRSAMSPKWQTSQVPVHRVGLMTIGYKSRRFVQGILFR